METLEVDLASAKQELALSKKRVAELQHALEDDMNYDSDGLSHEHDSDLSDDSDANLETSSVVPSEPRSYRSMEDLEDDDELELKLKKKLSEIKDTTDARSDSGGSSTRRTSGSTSLSPKSDKDDDTKKRRSDHRSREGRRQKSIEKRRSQEKMSQKTKGSTPGAFDI